MINILIDTCSWIDLLQARKNVQLEHLKFWQENGFINLVTHVLIIEEWNRHKVKHKKEFEKRVKEKYNNANEIIRIENPLAATSFEPDFRLVQDQIEIIDTLLNNCQRLDTPDLVKILATDRALNRKAPFHNNSRSQADACIIFSTLDHFKHLNEDFLFVSSNKNDFGDPSNKGTQIHPELVEDYHQINVRYFSGTDKAINSLKGELPRLNPSAEIDVLKQREKDEVDIDKRKSLLDQLENYLKKRTSELNFVPTHILTNHYPFRKNLDSRAYYATFTIVTDNDDLFELFESFNINDKQVELEASPHLDQKVKWISETLRGNLVYSIQSDSRSKYKNYTIPNYPQVPVPCALCSLEKFRLTEAISSTKNVLNKPKELLQLSYFHYRIGNFLKAEVLLRDVYQLAIDSGLHILAYIAVHNRFQLNSFIQSSYYGGYEDLTKELEKLDLHELSKEHLTSENQKIIKWIRDKTFITRAQDEIQKVVKQIIDQYHSSLYGGWSSNGYISKLINEYAELELFISENHIVYNRFRSFRDISRTFFEGLFASYAIEDKRGNKLHGFDDWLLKQMLKYGRADEINTLFRRYRLEKLAYTPSNESNEPFEELINNFFSNNYSLKNELAKISDIDSRAFWDYYNETFNNILTVLSLCDFKPSVVNSFTQKLIQYLESDNGIYVINNKYIYKYIKSTGKKLSIQNLKKLFAVGLENSRFHEEGYFDAICEALIKKNRALEITKGQFLSLIDMCFNRCSKCKANHENNLIVPIYNLLKRVEFRKEISNRIESILEVRFDFDLFYNASIFEIIPFDLQKFNKALVLAQPSNQTISFREAFGGRDNRRLDRINEIINLCFKYQIDTAGDDFKIFADYDNYYKWLLNMGDFDYEMFEPKWIGEYGTRFYLQKIYSSNSTRVAVEQYLKEQLNTSVERSYVNIYIRKWWAIGS